MDLSSLSSKLLPGFTTLGFKDERRGKGESRGQVGVAVCSPGPPPRPSHSAVLRAPRRL